MAQQEKVVNVSARCWVSIENTLLHGNIYQRPCECKTIMFTSMKPINNSTLCERPKLAVSVLTTPQNIDNNLEAKKQFRQYNTLTWTFIFHHFANQQQIETICFYNVIVQCNCTMQLQCSTMSFVSTMYLHIGSSRMTGNSLASRIKYVGLNQIQLNSQHNVCHPSHMHWLNRAKTWTHRKCVSLNS